MPQTNSFIEALQNTTYTENGALANVFTGSALVDLFFHGGALRSRPKDIHIYFKKALKENPTEALRTLFYLRDIRKGQGERLVFRIGLEVLLKDYPEWWTRENILLIPEFGRWDDLFVVFEHGSQKQQRDVMVVLHQTLNNDLYILESLRSGRGQQVKGQSVSLLAKWLPSENASNKNTVNLAKKFIGSGLFGTAKMYRKTLVELRSYLNIVERNLTEKNYKKVFYNELPGKAFLKYKTAFFRYDARRVKEFLKAVSEKTNKMNMRAVYPYDIVSKYFEKGSLSGVHHTYFSLPIKKDEVLEAAWTALPDYASDMQGLVLADTSGSMLSNNALAIACSLALYISERNKNKAFQDRFITFSDKPKFIKLKGHSLLKRLKQITVDNTCGTTDFLSVFELLLHCAVKYQVPQEEMPKMLLAISDMEFDRERTFRDINGRTLDQIKKYYADAGYTLPILVFWNVNSRNNQTPAVLKDTNVFLVSGRSPVILKSVLNLGAGNKDILSFVKEIINIPRYQPLQIDVQRNDSI